MDIRFDSSDLSDFRRSLSREWLETNGLGGYASGTIANCHTRKYHGLLVPALAKPAGTFALLSRLEDSVETGGAVHPLSTSQYGEVFAPDGHTRQTAFEQEPCPVFTYRCGKLTVTRRIMMLQGQDAVLVRYDAEGDDEGAVLRIRPLLAFRNIHAVTRANGGLNPVAEAAPGGFSIRPYDGMPALCVQLAPKPAFSPEACWYYNFKYAADAERGFEHTEDLFSPGLLTVALKPGKPVILSAATEPATPAALARAWQQEETRRRKLADQDAAGVKPEWDGERRGLYLALRRAARQFEIETPVEGPAIHAGYHWFGPWGRDTLISLPGLTFLQPGADLARGVKILKAFVKYEKRGLLPNFINPDGTGVYTAADTPLWFFWAVQQYLAAGGEHETVRRFFWPTMLSIIRNLMAGTENGMLVDGDGLLRAGTPATAVTWMDVQVGGRPVIPRWGYMVEINALWYNAVCFTMELKKKFRESIEGLDGDYPTRLRFAFVRKFWDANGKRLLDTVNEFTTDPSVRPNALFAVSLPYSPLAADQQKAVMRTLRTELFTPYGLRSLSPNDIRYRGYCQGENWVRELAYHQGSAWPWFLAHFAEALLKTDPKSKETAAAFKAVVAAFSAHLRECGVGSVSEVFDGEAPHAPRGSIAQAWNVAEVLRFLQVTG